MSILAALGGAKGISKIAGTVLSGLGIFQGIASGKRSRRESDRNYNLAREQFAYQQHANQLTRDREDNAVQRKMADMQAAGLHPTLAVGGGGAGAQAMSAGGASGPIPSREMSIMEQAKFGMMIKQMEAEIEYTRAQTAQVRGDTDLNHQRLVNEVEAGRLHIREITQMLERNEIDIKTARAAYEDLRGRMEEGYERHRVYMTRARQDVTHAQERQGWEQERQSRERELHELNTAILANEVRAIVPGMSQAEVESFLRHMRGIGTISLESIRRAARTTDEQTRRIYNLLRNRR